MNVSPRGIRFIEAFEGFVAHPADDGLGNPTVGYGHLWQPGEATSWTRAHAEAVLISELAHSYEPAVRSAFAAAGITPSQNEFDATVSFVYNLGPGVLDASHDFGRALRSRDLAKAADVMLEYSNPNDPNVHPGLLRRRKAERRVFLTPDPLNAAQRKVHHWRVELAMARAKARHATGKALHALNVRIRLLAKLIGR